MSRTGCFITTAIGDNEQALAEFGRAFQLQPNAPRRWDILGYVHRRQGQWIRCLDGHAQRGSSRTRATPSRGNLAPTYESARCGKTPSRPAGMRWTSIRPQVTAYARVAGEHCERERRHQRSARRAGKPFRQRTISRRALRAIVRA